MFKKVAVIGLITVLVILLLFGTKILNIQNMEQQGRDASSYHDISGYVYVLCGVLLCIVAFWTYHLHFTLGGILPWGIGVSSLIYGLYILNAKGVFGLII